MLRRGGKRGTKKTDKIDAQILALDMIPEAYRPTPRQREHRSLVRYRYYLQKRVVSVRNKIRRLLADYNADAKDLFTVRGLVRLTELPVSEARQVLDSFPVVGPVTIDVVLSEVGDASRLFGHP